MGTNNQQRRAAKKKRRDQRNQRASGPSGAPRPSASDGRPSRASNDDRHGARSEHPGSVPAPEELLAAAQTVWRDDPSMFEQLLGVLAEQVETSLPIAEQRLHTAIGRLWRHGWTPTDVVHVVGRQFGLGATEEMVEQVLADGRQRADRGQSLHPRWFEQLRACEEDRRAAAPSLPDDRLRLRHLVELSCLLVRLPPVAKTIPAPGEVWGHTPAGAPHLDTRMLAKVRALLAKAESTTFEDEADALTTKAQELIARHAIDEALLRTVEDVGEPSMRRLLVDDPYVDAKVNLIAEVADANRCRVVYSSDLGWVTVFGYDLDLDALELLTASLLTQATTAMLRHGSRRDASGRSRTRSFRRAFLLGFAQRIGERLRQATDAQVSATADHMGQLVPVMAARNDRVRVAADEAFPHRVRHTVSASNATGWAAGQAAAELAELQLSHPSLPHRP
jgi:hypothetical protein